MLRAVAAERRIANSESDRRIELVWTGPERDGAGTRDTAVVVRELLSHAEKDVLVSGYAVFGGKSIFAPLAERCQARPGLRARLFLNVSRDKHDHRSEAAIAAAFRGDFLKYDWPDVPLPSLFYDPRALNPDPERRAVLHAKCVVVDDLRAFVTSANLTEAAHSRNIEAGVLVEDRLFARSLRLQFDDLVARGCLVRLDP
jgi:phosphatidylserine/phosphatidylglycerophosphate/cardiolipin synthase-like enzyme